MAKLENQFDTDLTRLGQDRLHSAQLEFSASAGWSFGGVGQRKKKGENVNTRAWGVKIIENEKKKYERKSRQVERNKDEYTAHTHTHTHTYIYIYIYIEKC